MSAFDDASERLRRFQPLQPGDLETLFRFGAVVPREVKLPLRLRQIGGLFRLTYTDGTSETRSVEQMRGRR